MSYGSVYNGTREQLENARETGDRTKLLLKAEVLNAYVNNVCVH
ncbi:MAG: hypothetical protein SAK29_37770 [Scytonema sp. PMC 1069.18]|nr:hypothetical protein [Scytonema sp. PMC 1069.18]MEC4881264.1 hypothetical protein [Scytonema sp. PMC 1070.18]